MGANIPSSDIDEISDGNFLVKSQNEYIWFNSFYQILICPIVIVWLGSNQSHLEGKHIMAVYSNTEFGWNKLPEVYRDNPILNMGIDNIIYSRNVSVLLVDTMQDNNSIPQEDRQDQEE